MMTTNLFVIANVKQLRTSSSFRILLSFFQTSWFVGILNSAVFNISQLGWVWHDFGGPSEICGGGGLTPATPPTPPLGMSLLATKFPLLEANSASTFGISCVTERHIAEGVVEDYNLSSAPAFSQSSSSLQIMHYRRGMYKYILVFV